SLGPFDLVHCAYQQRLVADRGVTGHGYLRLYRIGASDLSGKNTMTTPASALGRRSQLSARFVFMTLAAWCGRSAGCWLNENARGLPRPVSTVKEDDASGAGPGRSLCASLEPWPECAAVNDGQMHSACGRVRVKRG